MELENREMVMVLLYIEKDCFVFVLEFYVKLINGFVVVFRL